MAQPSPARVEAVGSSGSSPLNSRTRSRRTWGSEARGQFVVSLSQDAIRTRASGWRACSAPWSLRTWREHSGVSNLVPGVSSSSGWNWRVLLRTTDARAGGLLERQLHRAPGRLAGTAVRRGPGDRRRSQWARRALRRAGASSTSRARRLCIPTTTIRQFWRCRGGGWPSPGSRGFGRTCARYSWDGLRQSAADFRTLVAWGGLSEWPRACLFRLAQLLGNYHGARQAS